ncbi:N-acetylglucosamine-specific PTS transporter subunit IIBC [Paenactinomyces guangxiensis]|uniref:PTS transporter subunit EIIC n=1 Tax=Paenactinomyces guangxiensis TaxID=1490290 RepID=A0A7W1WTR4_9BACL|nr:N-acetylglucosamine-specific PTS transporter subunit IIBC [Paenactinomyces guangxiensis]MBA4495838.1 PTS transporter subunit EIIC [Paenactinomyces guangxiensis]MBH8592928.1 PTS transporter subunit EIIC [Paenactinomyces guangxiensis]
MSESGVAQAPKKRNVLGGLQQFGKSLMVPVAVLPAAAILLSIGVMIKNPEFTQEGTTFFFIGDILEKAGNAILSNLPILFAIGIAMGFNGGAGAAALAAVVGYYVLTSVLTIRDENLDMKVFGGIITGLVTAYLYRRYHQIKLPEWLQFFGGKRFVPIITSFAMLLIGIFFMYTWPYVQKPITAAGNWLIDAGPTGLFAYGTLNRLLIPFGLHHILNNIVWFNVGEFTTEAGKVVTGDLTRFFAGDKTAGMFMAGFFPVLMFALPAACLAMIHEAKPSQRTKVAGFLISGALTAFVTGVTEPIEFAFMFLAPVLYLIHAILTGASMAIVYLLGIKHGFGFSAGLFDFLLNLHLSTKGLWLVPIGLIYAAIYYIVFRFAIRKFNLMTPGREEERDDEEEVAAGGTAAESDLAKAVLEAIGGKDNIEQLDACITRLRMTLKDESKLDKDQLKKLGAAGVIQVGKGNFQAVFGTKSEVLKDQILQMMKESK